MKFKPFMKFATVLSLTSILSLNVFYPRKSDVLSYDEYQESDRWHQNMLDDIKNYKRSSYSLLSNIQNIMVSEITISDSTYNTYVALLNDIIENLKNSVTDSSMSSLAYWSVLFKGESIEENSTYKDIVDTLLYASEKNIEEINKINTSFSDAISTVFQDYVVEEHEYDVLATYFRSLDSIASEVSGEEICNTAFSEITYLFSDLTESEKRLLKITLDYAIYCKKNAIKSEIITPYIPSRKISAFGLEELKSIKEDLIDQGVTDSIRDSAWLSSNVCADYILWLKLFGAQNIPDLESNMKYREGATENTTLITFDRISVTFNTNTSDTDFIMFLAKSGDEIELSEAKLYVLAFLAALEYGEPISRTPEESDAVKEVVNYIWDSFFKAANDSTNKFSSSPFYVSANGKYNVDSNGDNGIFINAE